MLKYTISRSFSGLLLQRNRVEDTEVRLLFGTHVVTTATIRGSCQNNLPVRIPLFLNQPHIVGGQVSVEIMCDTFEGQQGVIAEPPRSELSRVLDNHWHTIVQTTAGFQLVLFPVWGGVPLMGERVHASLNDAEVEVVSRAQAIRNCMYIPKPVVAYLIHSGAFLVENGVDTGLVSSWGADSYSPMSQYASMCCIHVACLVQQPVGSFELVLVESGRTQTDCVVYVDYTSSTFIHDWGYELLGSPGRVLVGRSMWVECSGRVLVLRRRSRNARVGGHSLLSTSVESNLVPTPTS